MNIKQFVNRFGQPYSELLGINLKNKDSKEICKWFLASILFAKPIQESCVIKTYKCFEKHGVLNPRKIVRIGWQSLVDILDEGSYTRYDFSTVDKLLEVFENLERFYDGDLNKLYERAKDGKDLEEKIKRLGKGIGNTTVSIFLRDMRVCWKKANPEPTPLVALAMKNLGIKDLKKFARGRSLVRLETALLRLAKDFCRKNKCKECLVGELCKN